MKHALAYFITARAVAAASLVAVSLAPAIAQSGSAPQIFPRAVTLAGTVSVRELSAKRGQSADAPDAAKFGADRGTIADSDCRNPSASRFGSAIDVARRHVR